MGNRSGWSKHLKYCAFPLCPNTTTQRYCPEHIKQKQQENAENERRRQQGYDKEQRNKESKAFYDSKEWKEKRAEIMRRNNNRCYYCGEEAKLVHHLDELTKNPDAKLENGNLFPVCYKCHNRIHSAKKRKNGQIE